MRAKHPQPHRTPRPWRVGLRRLAVVATALPLALGVLAATGAPATAGDGSRPISHSQTAVVGVPSPATFTCLDLPERPLVEARWYASDQSLGTVGNPAPGQGAFSFTRDVVFDQQPAFWMLGLTCDYSPLADGTDAEYFNLLVQVAYPVLATTTTVSFSPARVEPGMPINASATVRTVDGPATAGTVQFSVDGTAITGTSDVGADGVATTSIPTQGWGERTVEAAYYGTDTLEASVSERTVWVKAPTTVATVVPETVGAPRTVLTATPAPVPGLPAPSGTVTFRYSEGVFLGTAQVVAGEAVLPLPELAAGVYADVVAVYSGDDMYGGATSGPHTMTVDPATPDATLTGSTSTLAPGETITLVGHGFLPGETVSFTLHSDPVLLGTARADRDGVATLAVAVPAGTPAGEHLVRATGATSLRTAEIPLTVTAAAPVVPAPIVTVPVAVPVAVPVTAAAPAAVPSAAAQLASTGVEPGSTALLVSVLLGSGALLLAGRRRFATSAR